MQVLNPIAVTTAMLASSSVAENDYAVWSAATTYALDQRCISPITHEIYQSAQASNLNHDPTTDTGTWWLTVGPTNQWAMFDTSVSTQTTATDSIAVTLDLTSVSPHVALINMSNVTDVTVTMTVLTETVYTVVLDLLRPVETYEDYFFSPVEYKTDVVLMDLPMYASSSLAVTLTGAGTVGVGTLAMGRAINLGVTQYGVKAGITDYSRKTVDEWGTITITRRAYSKKFDANLWLDNAVVDSVYRTLSTVRSIPCVWIGAGDLFSCLLVFGYYTEFDIQIEYPTVSFCTISIEGLT